MGDVGGHLSTLRGQFKMECSKELNLGTMPNPKKKTNVVRCYFI